MTTRTVDTTGMRRHNLDKRHINQNNDFLKWHEFTLKFNLNVPFTTYYGLVNAIPRYWKANLKNPIQSAKYHTTVSTLINNQHYLLLALKSHFRSSHSRN